MSSRRIRHIAMWAMAAVMTVGCGSASEEEVLPSPPQPGQETPIAFSGSLSEEGEVTRTDPSDPAGLETVLPEGNKKFTVWAYKNVASAPGYQTVMNGYTVNWVENTASTTTSNTHDWEYVNQEGDGETEQSIKYWDFSAQAYRFFGSTLTSTGITVTEAGETVYRMTISADVNNMENTPYYSQLWYSDNASGSSPFGAPVRLEFLQPFSMVRFMFIFEDENDAPITDLTEKSFKPSDGNSIKIRGLVHIDYPLTGSATTETLSVDDGAEGMDVDEGLTQDYYEVVRYDGSGKAIYPYFDAIEYLDDEHLVSALNMWYTVLPAPAGQSSYTMTVKVNGEPKTAVVPAEFMTWLPGYRYTYIFKVHVDGGVSIDSVESAFTPWVIGEEDHTVFNW